MLKIAAATVGVLLVCLAFMSRKHPGIALGLVWCLYAMEQLLQVGFPIFIARSWLINVSVFGVTFIAAMSLTLKKGMFSGVKFPRPILWFMGLFLLVVCSVVWAPKPAISLQKLNSTAPYFLQFAVVSPLCILDRNQLDKAIKVLLYFGFFVLVGLALTKIDNRAIVVDSVGRGELVKGNPLAIAGFAGTVMLAAVFKIYGMKKRKGSVFLFHIAITILALLVLARSGSRGQVVAVVIAMTLWLPVTARVAAKRSSVLAMVTVLVFMAGLYYFVSNGADAARWNADQLEKHAFGRLEMANDLLTVWYDAGPVYWLFGLGSSASFHFAGFYPHVVPLEVLGEEGLIGFVLFGGFCLSVVTGGYRLLQRDSIEPSSRVNLGLVLAIFTFHFALSFKQGSLIGAQTLFGAGLTAAWYSAYLELQMRKKRLRYPRGYSVPHPQPNPLPYPQTNFHQR